ncbi:hypothetical protein RDWZM_003874 [Blomia tropicalis]|uniref:Ell-associated factor Eaf n=1 Tax=Blomia tropicalis TaxID=40697 RepID=A0A9Q0MGF0_BLOTA|nr:hypothetical protein RDWZM_003874 [Blomia tropicalis]
MSALADFAHKFGSQSRELKIGQSFFNDNDSVFHTVRYDFVPASVDPNKTSAVDFGQNGKVTVTMPNLEGSGTTESVYQGQRKPHQKECVLIINNETGDMVLEKLNTSMIVKKARLRQEDLTGKSLALNKSGNGLGVAANGSSSSASSTVSQSKISMNDKKNSTVGVSGSLKSGQSVHAAAKHSKQSPPQLSNSNSAATAQPPARSNGFHPKTPSPPSMPIFSANKGPLLRAPNGSVNNGGNVDANSEWNGHSKAKPKGTESSNKSKRLKSATHANRLSEDSSSDSSDGGNSDQESSSSPSSESSSDDDDEAPSSEKPVAANSRPNTLSMPTLSMPTSLVALSCLPDSLANVSQQSNNVQSPQTLSASNDIKRPSSTVGLTLSEVSDSSDDEGDPKSFNASSNKIEQPLKSSSVFTSESSKPFPDSMPKFPPASTFPSMPKFSQLSQDLQLSESGSDSDD